MINDTLIWFLLVPILGAGVVWWFTGHRKENLIPAGVYILISSIAIAAAFFISSSSATGDVEVWNGQVVKKERLHGDYVRSYECNCYTTPRVCTGSGSSQSCSGGDRICQTCYEDRYTVTWKCTTTIADITIKHLDTTSKSVYLTPDPQRWLQIAIGDPVSLTSPYTNYIQAVPNTLFRPSAKSLKEQFAKLIVPYPDRLYDFYRADRFVSPGHTFPDARAWNESIAELLKERGPRKQVNAVVVVAKTSDPNYAYALRDAWEGANKNDVVAGSLWHRRLACNVPMASGAELSATPFVEQSWMWSLTINAFGYTSKKQTMTATLSSTVSGVSSRWTDTAQSQ